MKRLVFLVPIALFLGATCSVAAQQIPSLPELSLSQSIATHMSEDGKVDKDRIVIFEFSYGKGQWCYVQSVTINNVSCAKNSPGAANSTRGIWPKMEFCNKEYCGDEFSCAAKRLDDRRVELIVKSPVTGGMQTHRIVGDGMTAFSYEGVLSKQSFITGELVSASYVPIKSINGMNYADVNVGCSKIEVPVLR